MILSLTGRTPRIAATAYVGARTLPADLTEPGGPQGS
jgi:hypothetical protein